MAAKGKTQAKGWQSGWQASQNFGDSIQQGWQNAGGAMQSSGQRAGSAIQQGWGKVPRSAKIGAGAGLMTGLAVGIGGVKGGYNAAMWGARQVPKRYGWWIIFLPIILAVFDYFVGKNGIPIDFILKDPNFIAHILFRGPFWFFIVLYWILRRPRETADFIFPAAMMFLLVMTMTVGGSDFWVFAHLFFAIITFFIVLRGFDRETRIGGEHWMFLVIFFMDIYGLASLGDLVQNNIFGLESYNLVLNRVLFPLWFFFYLALMKDSGFKTGLTVFVWVFYSGYIGWGAYQVYGADVQFMNPEATDAAKNSVARMVNNWRDLASTWIAGRISYAITGKVEENQFEPIGVYLENVQAADQKYYLDEDVIVWGTIKARTLDDPINIKVGCFAERDKKKFPANDVDPEKKFSVFTLEEQDFACTFNGTRKGFVSKLKEGANTIKAFADFNFETLSYLKVYFIDKERQRAMTREGLDIFEEFDITDKSPVAVYTNGPAKIEMGTTNPLIGVSESYPAEPSLGIDIQNREGWQGKITELKELVVFFPEGIDFDTQASCNKEFEAYDADKCRVNSCADIVRKECLEVCGGYLNQGETTNNAFESCAFECNENFGRCEESCNSFFREGEQKYNGYSLKPDEYKEERDFEKGIQLRCRFRPQPSILGNAPLTTKSFRVKARYQYNVEKSVSVNIQKDETSGAEGNVGAPLNLRIKGSDGATASDGGVVLTDSITIVWDKSINDGGNSNDVIRYRIYRKDGDTGEFNKKGEVDAKGTASYEYTDTSVDLSGNFKYSYYVDALNEDNKFEKSAKILIVSKAPEDGTPPLEEGQLYVSSQDQEKITT